MYAARLLTPKAVFFPFGFVCNNTLYLIFSYLISHFIPELLLIKLLFTNSSGTSSSSVLPAPLICFPTCILWCLQWRVLCCAAGTDSTARVCACATAAGRGWSVTCRRGSASTPAVAVAGPAPRAAVLVKQVTAANPARKVRSVSTASITKHT